MKGCQTMILKFSDIKNKLYEEYGITFETCPVGAHYMHGKVERKIRHIQESFAKCIKGEVHKFSILTQLKVLRKWERTKKTASKNINFWRS